MFSPDATFMKPSAEFVALCQSQVTLLTQGFKAAWSGVYLTEGSVEGGDTNLIPVALYPQLDTVGEATNNWGLLPEGWDRVDSDHLLLLTEQSEPVNPSDLKTKNDLPTDILTDRSLSGRHQIVLPLIYEEGVMGLLVVGRKDRAWNSAELSQIEKIAQTLAIACLLDRRQEWYQEQLSEQQAMRRIERDRLDNLLHQLRNPLTALRTFSKLLLKRLLPEDPNRLAAQGILRESDRLQELLQEFEEDLEALAPASSTVILNPTLLSLPGTAHVSNSPFLLPGNSLSLESLTVREVLEPLVSSAQAIAQERRIELNVEIPDHLPAIRANARALREVLNNLIDNALKYTPENGKVEVEILQESSTQTKAFQKIIIRDTGYGIPPEDQQYLFERHYRGVQAQGNIPGTGLGLAIAKELVEQMQGRIELISPNQLSPSAALPGTTFIIWLPIVIV
jgi:signal transduction histidine kinase